MTKEQAIKILEEIIDEGWLISDFEKCTAIDACEMAIKALEQEPDLDKIRAEIEELKNKIRKEHNYGADAVYGSHVIHGINAVLEIFDKYNAESEGKE